jgi:hypothetical protein
MQGRVSVVKLLLTIVLGTLFGGVVLGGFGFLLSGREGFVNRFYWGLTLGLIGSIGVGFGRLIEAHYWGGFLQRIGKSLYEKNFEDEEEKPDY